MNCRYCLNPELRDDTAEAGWYTPKELLSELEKDRYYFFTTDGVLTITLPKKEQVVKTPATRQIEIQ